MRGLWMMISTLAIANLLALGGFVAWLQATGRLSRDRVESLRALFVQPVAVTEAQRLEQEAEAERLRREAEEAAAVGRPPLTAEQRLLLAHAQSEVSTQQQQRIQRETADLIRTLMQERIELDRQRAEFQQQVEAFDNRRRQIIEMEGTEQFEKTVTLYAALKPDQARSMMMTLIREGQTDQVVAYLNALPTRTASRIIAQFQGESPMLAADLLERLRQRGTEFADAPTPEG